MKRGWTLAIAGLVTFIVTSCGNFGFVKNPNEGYTTHYNYPGTRVAPYNDPNLENRTYPEDVNVCTGVPSKTGFQCRQE